MVEDGVAEALDGLEAGVVLQLATGEEGRGGVDRLRGAAPSREVLGRGGDVQRNGSPGEGREEQGPAAGRQATPIRGAPRTAARDGQDQQRQPARNRAASGGSRGTILLQTPNHNQPVVIAKLNSA